MANISFNGAKGLAETGKQDNITKTLNGHKEKEASVHFLWLVFVDKVPSCLRAFVHY